MDTKKVVLDPKGASFVSTLFKTYEEMVYKYLLKHLRDSDLARDVTSTTFLRISELIAKGKYEKLGKDKSLVMTTAHNEMINHFRYMRRFVSKDKPYKFPDLPDTEPDSLESLEISDLISKILPLIDRLPKEQKDVFMMRIYLGMSFRDIAKEMSVPNNSTLRIKYRKAKQNLRNMLTVEGLLTTEDESSG